MTTCLYNIQKTTWPPHLTYFPFPPSLGVLLFPTLFHHSWRICQVFPPGLSQHQLRGIYSYNCLRTLCKIGISWYISSKIVHQFSISSWILNLNKLIKTYQTFNFCPLPLGKDERKWLPTDGGWGLHIASTVSEWIMALAFDVFIITYVPEFKQVTLDSPKVRIDINVVMNTWS